MRRIANSIIKKLKGRDYNLDERIPLSYLIQLIFSRTMMAIRGGVSRVNHKGYLFIAPGVTIKTRSKLKVGHTTSIGKGCFIDALSTDGVIFGNNVSMGKNVRIECSGSLRQLGKGIKVGNNVGLGADNFFGCAAGIEIGDDTIIGNYVSFHAENHNYNDITIPIRLQGCSRQGIKVGKNCWIGAKATILDGVQIGEGCIIAAGALMAAGKYDCNGIYAGVPAKFIKKRE